MKKEMLVNVLQNEECRIAILENGILEELYVERTNQESYVGNIYKGRIVNIEPSIQAAFVDFGVGRNGFLHISDVEPTYWKHLEAREERREGRRDDRPRDSRPSSGRPREERRDEPSEARALPPAPAPQPKRAPAPRVDPDFGAGLEDLLDPAPTPPTPARAEEARPAEAPPSATPPAPLTALPGTEIEEDEEKKPRRRSRGGKRRKAEDEGDANPPRAEAAEHRTEAESEPVSIDYDPDLFFPPPRQVAQPPAPVAEKPAPPPPAEEEPRAEPAYLGPPPRRVRPEGMPRNIEDALEQDLAEADVLPRRSREEAPPAPRMEAPREREEPEPRRERQPAPAPRPSQALLDEDVDFDEDGPRGGRGSSRRQGRGRDARPGRDGGRPGAGKPRPLIQDVFKRGQEVIVQVIKEGIGTKGPTLSTYISIPGRYLVLMPCLNRTGVSRKIEDDEQRRRLRQMFNELKPPRGLGFIMRTAAIDKNKKEVQRDLVYLSRLWQVVGKRIKKAKSPCEIYQESDMVTRTIRDNFTADIDAIWVDEKSAFEAAQEFMQAVMPRYADRIKQYEGQEPLFDKFGLEKEIDKIHQKKVPLPLGGSIVIEQTEALVAIDVNSGSFRADGNNAEETAYQMNLQAAKEIARQLRLRDLGGVIVNDFIDMRDERHRRQVERTLRDAMRRDRARTKILRTSQFGIIEMTRQRIRPSLKRSGYIDCPHCKANGMVKSPETMAIEVMRQIQLASTKEVIRQVDVAVSREVAEYLLNRKRREIVRLEEQGQMSVTIRGVPGVAAEHNHFVCLDQNSNEVRLHGPEPVTFRHRR